MKKHIIALLIISAISTGSSVILTNFFKQTATLVIPGVTEFVTWFFVIFIIQAGLFFTLKTSEKLPGIPDGHQKLYNEQNQISKDGVFKSGKLVTGSKYIYNKNGSFSHIEIYKNGVYTHDALNDKHLSANL